MEALRAAVQRVFAVVLGQIIGFTIDVELGLRNPVCKASGCLAGARRIVEIVGLVFVAQDHIGHRAVLIRYDNPRNSGADSR